MGGVEGGEDLQRHKLSLNLMLGIIQWQVEMPSIPYPSLTYCLQPRKSREVA